MRKMCVNRCRLYWRILTQCAIQKYTKMAKWVAPQNNQPTNTNQPFIHHHLTRVFSSKYSTPNAIRLPFCSTITFCKLEVTAQNRKRNAVSLVYFFIFHLVIVVRSLGKDTRKLYIWQNGITQSAHQLYSDTHLHSDGYFAIENRTRHSNVLVTCIVSILQVNLTAGAEEQPSKVSWTRI